MRICLQVNVPRLLNTTSHLFCALSADDKDSLIALYLRSEMMYAAKEATKQKREAKKLLLASATANAATASDGDEDAIVAAGIVASCACIFQIVLLCTYF